ncbi:MAG: amidohydrolase [Candidatus Fimadaptatus sp.]
MNTLIDNARLWTGEEALDDACIQVAGARIAYAGPRAQAPAFRADETIDARGGIALPGLVNAHTHLPMTMVRGVGTDLPLMDWLHTIWPLEDRLTPDMMRIGTQMSALEALRTGTTCFADAYMMSGVIAETVLASGMRLNICRMMTGGSEPAKLREQKELFTRFDGAEDGRARVYMGLHAEYTSDESLARDLAAQAGELGTGLHVHVSETRSEVEECRGRRGGRSPVEYLRDMGALDVPVLAAHCVWVDDGDMAIMKEKGVTPVHNPVSNLKLASGIAPVERMREAGLGVALGTDGAASNNTLDMFEELKLTAILQKGATNISTAMPATAALAMASQNGARALGFNDVGLLRAGWRADIALMGTANPAHTASRDIPGTLVYASSGADVRMTMVDGRVLYLDGEFRTLDAERIRAEFARATGELLG